MGWSLRRREVGEAKEGLRKEKKKKKEKKGKEKEKIKKKKKIRKISE